MGRVLRRKSSAPRTRRAGSLVHALFWNFADGEVARHIPRVLEPDELDQLVDDLAPVAAVLVAAGSQ